MLVRIRQQPLVRARVDWGGEPTWQLPLPAALFGGDTVLAWAGFDRGTGPGASVRLLEADAAGAETERARTCLQVRVAGRDLLRIAASRRLARAEPAQALQLALEHQLLTDSTHFVLVRQRADADKPTQAATQVRVPNMLAAGWGGHGTVSPGHMLQSPGEAISCMTMVEPSEFHDSDMCAEMSEVEPALTLAEFAQLVVQQVRDHGDLTRLSEGLLRHRMTPAVMYPVYRLGARDIDEAQIWLLLAIWVLRRTSSDAWSSPEMAVLRERITLDKATLVRVWRALCVFLGPQGRRGRTHGCAQGSTRSGLSDRTPGPRRRRKPAVTQPRSPIAALEARVCLRAFRAPWRGRAAGGARVATVALETATVELPLAGGRASRHELRLKLHRGPTGRPVLRHYLDGMRMERRALAALLCAQPACPQAAAARQRWRVVTGQGAPAPRPPMGRTPHKPGGARLVEEVVVDAAGHRCVARPASFTCATACPEGAHPPAPMPRSGWDLFEDGVWIAGGLCRNRETGTTTPRFETIDEALQWLRAQGRRARSIVERLR